MESLANLSSVDLLGFSIVSLLEVNKTLKIKIGQAPLIGGDLDFINIEQVKISHLN